MIFWEVFEAHWFFSIEAPYITKLCIIRQLKNNPVKGADFELYSLGGSERFRHLAGENSLSESSLSRGK